MYCTFRLLEEGEPAEDREGEGDGEDVAADTEVEEEAPGEGAAGETTEGADEVAAKTPKKRSPGDEIPKGSTPTPGECA